MRIVSQDRAMSFNFDSIVLWTQSNMIYAKIGTGSKVLGCYGSAERVAEVFKDIHKKYCSFDSTVFQNIDFDEEQFGELLKAQQPIVVKATDEKSKVEILPIVYYMPEE